MELPRDVAAVLQRIAQIDGTREASSWANAADSFGTMVSEQRRQGNRNAFGQLIADAASRWRLDPNLVTAVVENESGFDPQAVSATGAVGLMQLEPTTASELGVGDPYDARQNLEGGSRYLRGLLDRFNGNLPLALAAYNAGPHAVEKYGGIPPYAETRAYVQNVLATYHHHKKRL